jgi:hypothetical protein
MPDDAAVAMSSEEQGLFSNRGSNNQPLKSVRVRFIVPEFVTSPGQRLVVCGSSPMLGSWNTAKGAIMQWHPGHKWIADVELEAGWHGALEFKVRGSRT